MLDKYVKNNNLVIDAPSWEILNKKYSSNTLLTVISDTIDDYKINLPLENIEETSAVQDFIDLVCLNTEDILTTNIKQDSANGYTINYTDVGNISSNYFHQFTRFKCGLYNSPSPYTVWRTEEHRKVMLNSIWTSSTKEINADIFRSKIGHTNYISPQFRPSAAKAIYKKFNSKKVLDFSAKWGDRLSGFMSCEKTKTYYGISSNVNLLEGYIRQTNFYNYIITAQNSKVQKKNTYFFPVRAENLNFDYIDTVDTILASIPLFNVERHDNAPYITYKTADKWLDSYLFKIINKGWDKLEYGGKFIIRIENPTMNTSIHKICSKMNEFIKKLHGAIFEELLWYALNKTSNTGVEPLWVWTKKT